MLAQDHLCLTWYRRGWDWQRIPTYLTLLTESVARLSLVRWASEITLWLLTSLSPLGNWVPDTKLSPIRPYYRPFSPQRQQKTKEIGRKIAKLGRAIRYLVGEKGSMAVRLPYAQSLRDQCHLLTHLDHPVTLHDDDGDGDLNPFLNRLQHDFQCYFQFH